MVPAMPSIKTVVSRHNLPLYKRPYLLNLNTFHLSPYTFYLT